MMNLLCTGFIFMEQEKWYPIKGTMGMCEVSSLLRIRTVKRQRKGVIFNLKTPKILKGCNARGYLVTNIFYYGKARPVCVHRIIAIQFIPNPKNLPFINHINGIKNDNRIQNLEWCTQKENAHHAIKIGLTIHPKGESVWCSKLSDDEVTEIYNSTERVFILAKKYKISRGVIDGIKNGSKWKHITQR